MKAKRPKSKKSDELESLALDISAFLDGCEADEFMDTDEAGQLLIRAVRVLTSK